MMISAGSQGIIEKLPKPEPSHLDVYHLSQEERDKHRIRSLPGSLEEALGLARGSELVRNVVGDRFLDDYAKLKQKEIDAYKRSLALHGEPSKDDLKLSRYELEKLLPIL
jgi:glutamine synthetase